MGMSRLWCLLFLLFVDEGCRFDGCYRMVEGFGVVLGWVFYCGNGYVFERFWLGIGNKVVGVIGFCFGKFG